MRRGCALALALALAAALALGIAGAAGAAQAADAPPRRRRRPGGGRARGDAAVDARGRPAECAACHRVVVHLDEELVPELDAAAARQRAGGKRAHWGLLEETIERAVEGACSTTAVQADPRVRAACTRFLDAHEGEVVRAFYRYATDEPALNLAAELCAAECPSELAALTVQQVERLELDIAQEEAGPSSAPPGTPTRVLSEVPTPAAEQGALARVVAADVISFAMKDAERDIVLYVAAPADGGAPLFDAALRPRLQRVAEELSHRSATLGFGVLDVQRNELPPVIAVIAEGGREGPPTRASLLLLRASLKHKPVSLVAVPFDDDDDTKAPSVEQLYALLDKWASTRADREAAALAAVEAVRARERGEEL